MHRLRAAGLDYLELGAPDGRPVVYLHGTPSSAREAQCLDASFGASRLRLLAPDRPGYLGSSAGDASLLGRARRVLELADALALERFTVVGFSGGSAFALATAFAAPERVQAVHAGGAVGSVSSASGLAAWRRALFAVVRVRPLAAPLVRFALRRHAAALERRLGDPCAAALELFEGAARGAQVDAVQAYVERTDAKLLRAEVADHVAASRCTDAVLDDMAVVARPWPFPLREVRVPVHLWHGDDDPAVPPAFAEALARDLPDARLHAFPGEGHFVFHTHGDEVAASIAAAVE